MNEEKARRLQQAGIDTEELLGRFMGNESLMMRFLTKFTKDETFGMLEQALEKGDVSGAYTAAHTLKGMTGNLSLKELYKLVCIIVESLRREDINAAKEEMIPFKKRYDYTLSILQEISDNS